MRETAVGAVLIGSLCLFSCSQKSTPSNSSGSSSTESTPVASASPPTFTVCSGTYALCTTAKCTFISGVDPSTPKLSCECDVKQGYSAGAKSCTEVPQPPAKAGDSIPSRYYPITSMAVCSNARPWASCLDAPCTVEPGLSKARCICDQVSTPTQSYVVVTNSYNGSTCRSDIWSSATVQAVIQITGFLQDSQQLKASPITIVGVGAAKE